MYICELTYPGMQLDYSDAEWASTIRSLFSSAESSLAEASLALTWFEDEQGRPFDVQSRTEPEADATSPSPFREALAEELGSGLYDPPTVLARLECEAKREKWKRGILPESYRRQLVFMHAEELPSRPRPH